ncbi:MAG: hypothetical protein MJZ14_05170 [Paludibacteraceae bacterium]|nr:hypothetical protein [Paludibacteraceae bacterium]
MKKFFFYLTLLSSLIAGVIGCSDDEEETPKLELNATELTFKSEGGDELVGVTSNTNWSAVSSEKWCEVSPASSKGDGAIKVTAQKNEKRESRTAKISVVSGSLTRIVVVFQAGVGSENGGSNGSNNDGGDTPIPTVTYQVTLTSSPAAGGTVTGGGSYEQGETVTLKANPSDGYVFDKWSDDVITNPRMITVTGDERLTASFEKKQDNLSESGKEGGYSYVDLGLSVRWATYNVGATKLTEYGDHFAWGETTPKDDYSWSTYKWGSHYDALTKYNTEESYGIVDNKIQLDPEDDAAAVNWKGKWRMPTVSELEELYDGCNWKWTDDLNGSGIAGYVGESKKNGKAIFLPAAGFSYGSDRNYEGSYGYYWSSSLDSGYPNSAYGLDFYSGHIYVRVYLSSRYYGYSVRAVCPSAR